MLDLDIIDALDRPGEVIRGLASAGNSVQIQVRAGKTRHPFQRDIRGKAQVIDPADTLLGPTDNGNRIDDIFHLDRRARRRFVFLCHRRGGCQHKRQQPRHGAALAAKCRGCATHLETPG